MKTYAIFAAGLIISACSGNPNAEAGEAESGAAVEKTAAADPSTWTSVEQAVGTYALLYDDGTQGTLTLMADGTSTGIIGGEEFTASVAAAGPGKLCYTELSNDKLPVPAQCWVSSAPRADGSWTSTGDDGTKVTVTPAN
jgi:hypothetical protein